MLQQGESLSEDKAGHGIRGTHSLTQRSAEESQGVTISLREQPVQIRECE